jgi:hypothetical protein
LSIEAVIDCLLHLSCKSGKNTMSAVEVANLVILCPTEMEALALAAYKGDITRLGRAEQLMIALLAVPQAHARAQALGYQVSLCILNFIK